MHRFRMVVAVAVLALVGAGCTSTGGGGGAAPFTTTVTVAGEVVTVSVPAGLTVTVTPTDPLTVPAAPTGLVFPLGALDIDVHGAANGAVVRVTVVLETPVDTVRKLVGAAWDSFVHDGTTGATLSADHRTVTLDLQDGGRGDSDHTVNGTIVDPFVPVNVTATTVTGTFLGQPVTLSVSAPLTLTVGAADPSTVPGAPSGVVFADGTLDIGVFNVPPGGSAEVAVDFQNQQFTFEHPEFSFRHPMGVSWDLFADDGTTGWLWTGPTTFTLRLQDGGRGDRDGAPNGTIVNWSALTWPAPVEITSSGVLPVMIIGQPYSYQLQATGGAYPISWYPSKGIGSWLPEGITLSPSGLLSGTPASVTYPYLPSVLLQVTAVSGGFSVCPSPTCDTKLLALSVGTASTTMTSTGQTLPNGTSVAVSSREVTAEPTANTWSGTYAANGTLARTATSSVAALGAARQPHVSRDGTMVAASFNNGTSLEVVNGDTGQTLITLPPGTASFSPNGAYLAVSSPGTAAPTRIYRTTDWLEARNPPPVTDNSPGSVVWKPDSTQFVSRKVVGGIVSVFSATDDVPDPSPFSIAGQTCDRIMDWSSSTDRLLFDCGSSFGGALFTASASNGSDVRVIAPSTCGTFPLPTTPCSIVASAGFSPNGVYLLLLELDIAAFSNPGAAANRNRLAYVPDDPGAARVPITNYSLYNSLAQSVPYLNPWS